MTFDDKIKSVLAKFYGWLPKKLTANPWLMESVGVLLFCVPVVKLLSYTTPNHWIQSGLTWALFQWASVEYEERWDPNGWEEGNDVLMRMLIATIILILYAIF